MKTRFPFRARIGAVWTRIRAQNMDTLCQIWSDRYPPESPKKHTFLEKVLLSPPLLARALSLSNLVSLFREEGMAAYLFIDLYVLTWLCGLAYILFWSYPPMLVGVVLAIYRIVEIVNYQLCVLLIDSQTPSWRLASLRRSFLFSFLNLIEIVLAFGIIYLFTGGIVQANRPEMVLNTPLQAFYYSLVTMATLGYGEFVPSNDISRGIVILELLTEILFVLAIVPAFVSNVTNQLASREYKDPGKRC